MLREQRKRVAVMHGDLPQPMRNRIMQGFRDGKIVYLVATDVVGRGIDVKNISHVINYDLPLDPENYVHRIGRTGRIGADGVAVAFVTPEQGEQLTDIEAFINQEDRAGIHRRLPGLHAAHAREDPKEFKTPTPVFGRRVKKLQQPPVDRLIPARISRGSPWRLPAASNRSKTAVRVPRKPGTRTPFPLSPWT